MAIAFARSSVGSRLVTRGRSRCWPWRWTPASRRSRPSTRLSRNTRGRRRRLSVRPWERRDARREKVESRAFQAGTRPPRVLGRYRSSVHDWYVPDATVLVIDDEPQIRRVLRNALDELGVRVREADTARQGLDVAAAERVDLIVLDLGLPDMQGLEVCRDIRGWTSVPILVLSARHSDSEKVALLDSGA